MVTLRCTSRLLDFLDTVPVVQPEPATSTLGDWYATLVQTVAGELVVFVNERTLLTVAVPGRRLEYLVPLFVERVGQLLDLIGIPPAQIDQELSQMDTVQVGTPVNDAVLGSMDEIAVQYQCMAEDNITKKPLKLSAAEWELSESSYPPLGDMRPAEVVRELLRSGIPRAIV